MNAQSFEKICIPDPLKDTIIKVLKGEISLREMLYIVEEINQLDKETFDEIMLLIFHYARNDLSINKSKASKGIMGVANLIGRSLKNLNFWLNKNFLRPNQKVILAEGDSWFEHLFINDILDNLIKKSNYSIYTLAFGGDWLGNILQNPKYLDKLKKLRPSAFLLSGGGNDLVGRGRLTKLVKKRKEVDVSLTTVDQEFIDAYKGEHGEDLSKKIVIGRKFFRNEFWSVLNVFTFQYLLIIRSIENIPELKDTRIITQGYDYAIPSNSKYNLFRKLLGHGGWLYYPLKAQNITDGYHQQAIVTAMIFEFNEMLIYLAKLKKNVSHIDCREVARLEEWNDELHLHSKVYESIALTYIDCIEDDNPDDIFTIKNRLLRLGFIEK